MKQNSGKSFEYYKSTVCHSSILHWIPEQSTPQGKTVRRNPPFYLVVTAAILILTILLFINKGAEFAGNLEEWTLKKIYSGTAGIELWETSIVQEGNFQIKFPSKPVRKSESLNSMAGMLEHITYLHKPPSEKGDDLAYAVSFTVYPPHIMNSRLISHEQAGIFFTFIQEDLIKEFSAEMVAEKDISYGLYPGREFEFALHQSKGKMKCRLILADNTLYTLEVTSGKKNKFNKEADCFLNSFKLLEYARLE